MKDEWKEWCYRIHMECELHPPSFVPNAKLMMKLSWPFSHSFAEVEIDSGFNKNFGTIYEAKATSQEPSIIQELVWVVDSAFIPAIGKSANHPKESKMVAMRSPVLLQSVG